MNHNPIILTGPDLILADQLTVLKAIYEYQVASTSLFFGILILYFIFRFCLWFFPKYWHLPSEKNQ